MKFKVFDRMSGVMTGRFQVSAGRIERVRGSEGGETFPPGLEQFLQQRLDEGGEAGLRRYVTSQEPFRAGYIFREVYDE